MTTFSHLWQYLTEFLLDSQNFQIKIVQKIKPHTLCPITFFLNHAIYEKICKNKTQPKRPHMTIWCMRIGCWMTKATHIHTIYVILSLSPGNSGFAKESECYVTRTLPLFSSLLWQPIHTFYCIHFPTCFSLNKLFSGRFNNKDKQDVC
jgi:hypothetical protein